MPLQQLIEHFNTQMETRFSAGYRPFLLESGQAYGLCNHIKIGTLLTPIRNPATQTELGHAARLLLSPAPAERVPAGAASERHGADINPVINFDRLCRTVHMLNFLPLAHRSDKLLVDVDVRHIIAVKQSHGAYFEEIIHKCGLETRRIILRIQIDTTYNAYRQQLDFGLDNYRRLGYGLALKFEPAAINIQAKHLVTALDPDFVCFSAHDSHAGKNAKWQENLNHLHSTALSINRQSILFNVDTPQAAQLAKLVGISWVQGWFYEQLAGKEQA
ncbi:MAG: hypothetical protein CTY34_11545 [Methylobacter sp.]|nr:MAG: hypothetical protein CTY34_11545 [Methylobacter sp.]PPD02556.1 MAG: hypothetical protein CTY29_12615 [Methylobacter sp.]